MPILRKKGGEAAGVNRTEEVRKRTTITDESKRDGFGCGGRTGRNHMGDTAVTCGGIIG